MHVTNIPARPALERLRRLAAIKVSSVVLLVLTCAPLPGHALINAVDDAPAATLLFPYFEVDLDNATGVTTIINITNASATAIVAHLTIWTDLGVPIFSFANYLTGYDLQQIDLRNVLVNGTFPQDASASQDPGDTRSPKGQYSQDINFASCTGFLPKPTMFPTWQLPTQTVYYLTSIESLQKELTGKSSTRQTSLDPNSKINCVAHDYNARIARGYITVDTVNACTQLTPADGAQYHSSNNSAKITGQNVMVGDYIIFNASTNSLQLGAAAHIEAASSASLTGTGYPAIPASDYTFYGRYVGWSTSLDQREPLASNWIGLGATGHTDAMVWRDTKTAYTLSTSFTCPANINNAVTWQPLTTEQLVAFDTQEGTSVPSGTFSYATGRYGLGSSAMTIPSSNKLGWFFGNLNATIAGVNQPANHTTSLQSFVTFMRRPEGGAFGGTSGAVGYNTDNGNNYNHLLVQ